MYRDHVEQLGRFGPVHDGPWFRFSDTYGTHWCQPDALAEFHDRVLIVECKLSLRQLDNGLRQLRGLYRPIVELVFDKPAVLVIAFKHWTGIGPEQPFEELEELEQIATIPLSSCKQPYGLHIF